MTVGRLSRPGGVALRVVVDGVPRDAALVGELLHGVRPSTVVADLVVHVISDLRLAGGEAYAGARAALRVATTALISSQSTSLKLCIGQNFGPHIEQNSADLK